MSRHQEDADTQNKSRPRANTTSFPSFVWRRPRTEQPSTPPAPVPPIPPQPLPLELLIEALTPPAVPSLGHARSLASALSTQSPLPRLAALNPVLASLCDVDSPVSVQAAGYDILSAYWDNNEAVALATADRLSYFSLFLGSKSPWGMELWEPRFKALRALTRCGTEIIGIETPLLELLKSWIEGGFEGLLKSDAVIERTERAERERSIDVLAKFFADVLEKAEIVARVSEEDLAYALKFYAGLVDQSILLHFESPLQERITSTAEPTSTASTPSKSSIYSHRRNQSSVSAASIPSPVTAPSLIFPKGSTKHPGEIAIALYLDHLYSQIKILSPTYLDAILPLLFRVLAFCASPLPRLTILAQAAKKTSSEDRITETLDSLFAGPYSITCMRILKNHLLPPSATQCLSHVATQNPPRRSHVIGPGYTILTAIQTSVGAYRTLRNYIRRALSTRLARSYISRESAVGYSHPGAPGHLDMERDLMERAWPKEDYTSSALGLGGNGWDAGRLGKVLAASVEAWVAWGFEGEDCNGERDWEKEREGKEKIMEEAIGVIKDILQELDSRRDEKGELDEEEAVVVGETLHKLAGYVLHLKNPDGTPFIVPVSRPGEAPTPLLRSLSSLLSREHTASLNPLLPTILIYVAGNLTDEDTSRLPHVMAEQHDLSPTSPEWLDNWNSLLSNPTLISVQRPLTRRAIVETLEAVYESVRDMRGYRRPLADMVLEFCQCADGDEEDSEVVWRILADEVVLRTVEREHDDEDDQVSVAKYIDVLMSVASGGDSEEDDDNVDATSIVTADTHSPSPSAFSPTSTIVSPLSKTQSDYHGQPKDKDKEPGLPSVMSIFSSLATGHTSRSQSIQPQVTDELPSDLLSSSAENISLPRVVAAVSALIAIFSQLVFTPFALEPKNLKLALHVYTLIIVITTEGKSTLARLATLQFLMRLRADRDHRLYFIEAGYDAAGHVKMLSSLINRDLDYSIAQAPERVVDDHSGEVAHELRKARSRVPQERDGRQLSRGRGAGGPSRSATSRSRSRAATYSLPLTPAFKPREPLWNVPESLPFSVAKVDSPSEALITYDPEGPNRSLVLPISSYLSAIVSILDKEMSWEILSYVLCHLPVQLANKHLFCGPKSREIIAKMLSAICTGILNNDLASHVDGWPAGLKARDAQGLAHHTLSVLVSYRRCFDLKQCHLLVEVFQAGLNGQFSTIKCCLHALSLSAFELQSSMTKCLSRILQKLSQIMSDPNMAVHILGFLSIIGSLPPLYANFTENDFKMVFGVALQYLQHYNLLNASPTMSWALSQHVRILSYYVVYVWFLAVRLSDRPRHIPYISRQLLIANEGNETVDEPTEVCFDWLARYTYASADPRPANSLLGDIVMNPAIKSTIQSAISEKTWVLGHAVVTVRTLARLGWVEVLCRRPSGFSKFLCRAENAPMVGLGDVDPDVFSVPAGLMMERDPPKVQTAGSFPQSQQEAIGNFFTADVDEGSDTPRPDPVTGYVWSGSAPSQRRKEVIINPSYIALQLSGYPDRISLSSVRAIADPSALSKFVTSLDRIPVIDTHKVGIMYVAPGQSEEAEILSNTHGSPAYTRFLEGIARLIDLRGQLDVYAGGLDPDEDGEYAYAWWDDIGQILYHTATMMPTSAQDPQCNNKKRHIGNDYVRIVWNDSGKPYRFDTLSTQFQFVNIVIEPHSLGAIAAFSNNLHENEYFKVTVQRAPGMTEFAPVGHFKLISAENLPLLVRQLSLLSDWFASVFAHTQNDTVRVAMKTNWHTRLEAIRRFKNQIPVPDIPQPTDSIMGQSLRDFTSIF